MSPFVILHAIVIIVVFLVFLLLYREVKKSQKEKGPAIKFEDIEEIEYVSVVRVRIKTKAAEGIKNRTSLDDSLSFSYKLNLIIDSKQRKIFTVERDSDLSHIMSKAIELKNKFECKLFDCSTSNKKWID